MGFVFRSSRAANSVVHGRVSPNFELIQALMYIIVTCKYEMNPIKNVRENVKMPFKNEQRLINQYLSHTLVHNSIVVSIINRKNLVACKLETH